MIMIQLLRRNWGTILKEITNQAESKIFISSPYITVRGTEFLLQNLSDSFRKDGEITILTNLSPINMTQGTTDPDAIKMLASDVQNFILWHLPSLHAKVYISDEDEAIVTSANLTMGGLVGNYEYGIHLSGENFVKTILSDIVSYSQLGSKIEKEKLLAFSKIVAELKDTYKRQQASTDKSISKEFDELFRDIDDELVKSRLDVGPVHNIFSKTILYLLNKHGRMATEELHDRISQIHPDLCDNSIDRVIAGRHFGKKWKHYVRSAQQHLKKKGLIKLDGKFWGSKGIGN